MCNPAVIPYVVAAVGAVYGAVQTGKNADRQEEALRKQQKVQDDEIQDAASVATQQRIAQARQERAKVRAASAESGVAGISIGDLLSDVDFQSGMDTSIIANNMNNSRRASATGLGSNLAGIEQADWVAAGLTVASQGSQGYDAYQSYVPPGGG